MSAKKDKTKKKGTVATCLVAGVAAAASLPPCAESPVLPPPLVDFGAMSRPLLKKLLADKTANDGCERAIVFGTDSYAIFDGERGTLDSITTEFLRRKPSLVRARVEKSREDQSARTKKRAEVFTPSWLCKKMVDFLDTEIRSETSDWKRYVDIRVLEITCGEAPFIVSRYDATTGVLIPVTERIGVLDRKLKAVSENAADETEWSKWAVRAFESVYGYEYQGDSLAIARFNLLTTFADHLRERWGREATEHELVEIANRISWNFWQMDGLKGTTRRKIDETVLPGFEDYVQDRPEPVQEVLFPETDGVASEKIPAEIEEHECFIYDWRRRKPVKYNDIANGAIETASTKQKSAKKGSKAMRFDYAIGNPPYQEETGGTCTSDKPIYNMFMDEAYKVANKVELITPARFLFNAGATPKAWNKKMLADTHLKVLDYVQKSELYFGNTDIKGGVAITYHDVTREFSAIETFTSFPELNSIVRKVDAMKPESLTAIISNRGLYRFSQKAYDEQPEELKKTSDPRISTNAFEEMPVLFTENKPDDGCEYFQVYGNLKGKRVYRWFRSDYCNEVENLAKYKVLLPKANGSGAIGEVLSTPIIGTPIIGTPMIGFTETYISVGNFESMCMAEACLKYIKSKFARTLLGVCKITQDNTKPVWRKVPLQDFTSASDIDWTKSVHEIDLQLYKKYGLSDDEVKFIEEKVKAME